MLEPMPTSTVAPAGSETTAHEVNGAVVAAQLPFVSVVIPCFNEERYIGAVIERIVAQYDEGRLEIIVVDGNSTDNTRVVVNDCAARLPQANVRLLDNPARRIPNALNLGIAAARGEIIARMDAHAIPSANYLRRSIELLGDDPEAIVGMPCRIRAGAETATAHAIAQVVAHPFGIGDAQYRIAHTGGVRAVDTVPFGVYRKTLWQQLGGFNESLLANEDYDFNYRARQQGVRVLLDTAAHTVYFARPTLKELARQYFRYGHWKAQMLKLHPRSMRLRHAVAPLFVAALIALGLSGLLWHAAWSLLLLMLLAYLLPAFTFAFKLARREGDYKMLAPIIVAFFVVHCSWGGGFWRGIADFGMRIAD
jgi:cellulose synthase/poly-beta-1,6-N-acetylglucosamine synthase-like glycosyltransferase